MNQTITTYRPTERLTFEQWLRYIIAERHRTEQRVLQYRAIELITGNSRNLQPQSK